nr:helix-turn-helix domain-containing protein [Desulfovibrio piger]
MKDILFAVEEECLRQALQRCATMHEAAQMLGMHPTTLWRKLAQHNMGQEGKA